MTPGTVSCPQKVSTATTEPLLARTGRWCGTRWKLVTITWLILLGITIGGSAIWGGTPSDDFSAPGSSSENALQILGEHLPNYAGAEASIVFHIDNGSIIDHAATIEAVIAKVRTQPGVSVATNPFDPSLPTLSREGDLALSSVRYSQGASDVGYEAVARLDDAAATARADGVTVELGGGLVQSTQPRETRSSEGVGIAAALVILLIAFGSIIAAGLPVAIAVAALGVGLSTLTILAAFTDIPSVAPGLAAMIGLGVGIDYALLIVTRFREQRANGLEPLDAVAVVMATAGRSVVFAGGTVIIGLAGLLLAGLPLITAMALAIALIVVLSVLAALTLLPALLGAFGHRVRLPKTKDGSNGRQDASGWRRWTAMVSARPAIWLFAGIVGLGILAIPALSMELGQLDGGTQPTSQTQRRAYDLLGASFGPGSNGPLLVTVQTPNGDLATAATAAAAVAQDTPGVATVLPPIIADDSAAAAIIVLPTTAPRDTATSDLVQELRSTLPVASGATIEVGGLTATLDDVAAQIQDRLPLVIAAVLIASFLLLTAMFRAPIVAAKAAILNILGIAAAYGVVVAVFQWGWGLSLIGINETVPIVSFIPLLMFAFLFGLSMDYEVFILSRVREEWLRTRDGTASVVAGIGATARVVTCAALIMIGVFISFIAGDDPNVKMMGLGLAVAVALDATIVRGILVPASMALLGRHNWWCPTWLDHILPNFDIEGANAQPMEQAPIPEAAST